LFAEVDCFYASVERADDPSLSGRPVVVGGDPRKRGLVAGASREALAAGVKLDMPVVDALKLCPDARATRTDMHRYREVSRRLLVCLRRDREELEPFGLSAAYFEVSADEAEARQVAASLRAAVAEQMGLDLRVGIASGKFLARLAAEESGPDGIAWVGPESETRFLQGLDVLRLEGVGEKTAATLAELGASTIGEVLALGRDRLQQALGTHGLRIHSYASGVDGRPVRVQRHAQSLSREATLPETTDLDELGGHLLDLADRLERELREQALKACRIAVKVRFSDRGTTTRSQTLATAVGTASAIQEAAARLLTNTQAGSRPARGVGIQLSRLEREAESDRQLDLFPTR
jgi:DNA polymerase-4